MRTLAKRLARRVAILSLASWAIAFAPGWALAAFTEVDGDRFLCDEGTTVLLAIPNLDEAFVIFLPKGRPPRLAHVSPEDLYVTIFFNCLELSRNTPKQSGVLAASVASQPVDATVADLNGDGRLDVAIANQGTNSVSVMLQSADGAFAAPIESPTGTTPLRIVAGRFNHDKNVDLVTANTGDGGAGDLSLLRGKGDGHFRAPVSITAGSLPFDVGVGDFDEDGDLDLAVATVVASASAVVVRLGNGDGTFGPETPVATSGGVGSVVVARLNDDGHDDIVTNRNVLLGRGDGTFGPAVDFATGFGPNLARVGDVNGDGAPDVVALSGTQQLLSVLLGDPSGDGTLGLPRHYVTGNDPVEVAIADLDGDDRVDLLVSNAGDDHVSILRGRGDGTFTAPPALPSVADLASRSGALDAALADFTGDGTPDLVVANGSTAALLPGLGAGAFGARVPLTGLLGSRVVAGDWNGSGGPDLAITSSGKLSIALRTGAGTFAAPTDLALPGADSFADVVVAGQVDAGSVPDLLVANTGDGSVSVFLGNGAGGFTAKPKVAVGTFPNGIATGDFDDDGDLDMVTTNLGAFGMLDGSVRLALGNGDGTFQAPQVLRDGGIAPDSVVAADFNHDDRPDLAFVREGPAFDWDIEVLLADGPASFADAVPLGLGYDLVGELRATDFDDDGEVDLIVSLEGTKVALLLGKGNGQFAAPVLFDSGGGAALVADLDKDGLPDIATCSELGYVATLINVLDEPGVAFAPETTITNGEPVYATAGPTRRVRLRFSADEPHTTFECRLKVIQPVPNAGAWQPCTSPYRARLAPGKYSFLVRATDVVANTDPTPAKLAFKVVAQ